LPVKLGTVSLDQVFLVLLLLLTSDILGVDISINNSATINFPEGWAFFILNDEMARHGFDVIRDDAAPTIYETCISVLKIGRFTHVHSSTWGLG
jgi:hypothetical protein